MKTFMLVMWLTSGFYFAQIKSYTFPEWERLEKDHPKPVIIHLYTDWCAVCKIELFNINQDKNLVKILNENFYFISFEAEKTKGKIVFHGKEFNYLASGNSGIHELALALSKNKNLPVYPLWIFLDKNKNLTDYHEGTFKPENLKQKLQDTVGL